MPQWHQAEPGSNPIELAAANKTKNRNTRLIIAVVLAVCMFCVLPSFAAYKMATASSASSPVETPDPPTVTLTGTLEPSSTPTATSTATLAPGQPSSTPTRTSSPTPAPSQTPWLVTQIVTKVVQVAGPSTIKTQMVYETVVVMVTATPGPSQTPWFITATPGPSQTPWVIIITQIVEVTPTETPTPEPTPEPTISETPAPEVLPGEETPTPSA
jgi:hypothetical protein